jgi:signal transduction histidine kinase
MEERAWNILLFEDDADDIFLLNKTLNDVARDRFRLKTVTRLAEGMDLAAQQVFDVVLLDLTLPDSHGLETFYDFHQHFPELPVVVLTGLDDEDTAIRAVHEGAQDYLVKGHDNGALLVRAMLYAMERQRALRYQALLLQRENIDKAIAQMSDGVVVTDAQGRISSANRAACLLLNQAEGRCQGQLLEVVLSPFQLTPALTEMLYLPETATTFEIARPDTQPPLFIDARLTRLFDEVGDLLSTVLVLRDVTDERHARHVQANFFLLVSHKLRTPLSVIVGYLDLLKRLPREQVMVEWDHLLSVLTREVDRLHGMVQRLLEYKEASGRELEEEAEKAELEPALARAAGTIRGRYAERTLEVTCRNFAGEAGEMAADDLVFVLEQLLDNAVKFSDADPVRVTVTAEKREEGLRLAVADNGRGIPHEYFDRIFNGFVQVEDRATGQVPGLGVGLHMARQVVETYGGEMRVTSQLGEGSTFSFTVPAGEPHPVPPLPAGEGE